jgi:hypothetical protein
MSSDNGKVDIETLVELSLIPEPPAPEPRTISAPELVRKQFAPIRWAVPNLITEGVTILSGRPKMGKSWICLDLALAVASGGRVMGEIQVQAGGVLYLALEDGQRRLKERLGRLLFNESPPDDLHFATSWERLNEGGIAAIEAWLDENPNTRLIIIDTLAKVRERQRPGGNLYEQDYGALEPLGTMARARKIAILIVHHSRKAAADDVMDDISGSTGLTGTVDGVLVLRRARGEAEAELHATNRDANDQELALKWDATMTRWSIAGIAADLRISDEHKRIINLIGASSSGLTPKELATQLGGTNESTIRVTLRRMLDKGQIRMAGSRYVVPSARTA